MKTLLVLRHAKSSWKDPGRSDHDRPLNKRGKRDAPRMGRLVVAQSLGPDLILSSTAKRARRTAAAVAGEVGYRRDVHLDRRLYLASPTEVIEVLRDSAGKTDRVLVVGHNPGLEDLVARLTRQPEPLPTATLAAITLAIESWGDLTAASAGHLDAVWRPRDLQDDDG